MNENKWGFYGLIFGIIEFNLNLILYIYLKSITLIIWIISLSLALAVIIIMVDRFTQIKNNTTQIKELTEKLKRTEELNDIRLNIKELQRKVFK